MTKLTDHCDVCNVSGGSETVEIGRSRARVEASVVDCCIPHVEQRHIVDLTNREATGAVRLRAIGWTGEVEPAVDGCEDEVDVPVCVGRTPAVWSHAVHSEVTANVHHPVTWTVGTGPQQPRLNCCHRQQAHLHTFATAMRLSSTSRYDTVR